MHAIARCLYTGRECGGPNSRRRMANDSDELIIKVRQLRYSSNGRRIVYLFECMMWAYMLLDRTSLSWDRCLMGSMSNGALEHGRLVFFEFCNAL
jgi:hypothetical protein